MKTLNNKGMTLVEMIISIVILGLAATLLVQSFVSSMNVITRATLYRNASATIASSIETEDAEVSKDPNVKSEVKYTSAAVKPVKVVLQNGTQLQISGSYIEGKDVGSTGNNGTGLKYHEFLPSNYGFEVPASPVDGSK